MIWNIEILQSESGKNSLNKIFEEVNKSTSAKIIHSINLLEKHGPFLGMPYSKKLQKSLYELRILGKENIRIMYSFKNNVIYILTAFKKKSNKTPKKEIEKAVKKINQYLL